MSRRSAFTLIELIIVTSILAVLASVAISSMIDAAMDAKVSTARHSLRTLRSQLAARRAETGEVPQEIDRTWFSGGVVPRNPFNDGSIPEFHHFDSDDRIHPSHKFVDQYGAYWYNRRNGVVRCRIPRLGDARKELELYNRVNDSNAPSLSAKYE